MTMNDHSRWRQVEVYRSPISLRPHLYNCSKMATTKSPSPQMELNPRGIPKAPFVVSVESEEWNWRAGGKVEVPSKRHCHALALKLRSSVKSEGCEAMEPECLLDHLRSC